MIRAEDRDEDGIRIRSDPFDFAESTFVNSTGVESPSTASALSPD